MTPLALLSGEMPEDVGWCRSVLEVRAQVLKNAELGENN